MPNSLLVGAVAYHPRVVAVWEGFRPYFAERGLDVDYVLYSNYERLVDALVAGHVDLAWNTNTAYVCAQERLSGQAVVLGMRDVDDGYVSVLVARDGVRIPADLIGGTLALGSRDSGHAAILPLHFLRAEGIPVDEMRLLRFDTDVGKHGDTGDSERRVVEAVARGDAVAGALGQPMWAHLEDRGGAEVAGLTVVWTSPAYSHCCFTARPDIDRALASRWLELLLDMSHDDPAMRDAMDQEGVRRWLPGGTSGYSELTAAMRQQGYLNR
jgi:phosphonate transport system substrate-binding protein